MTQVPLALGVTWASSAELGPLVPDVLPRSEITAGLRIADPQARAARLAGRALMLAVLARALGTTPGELPPLTRVCEHCGGPHGRPRLHDADADADAHAPAPAHAQAHAHVTVSLSRASGVVVVGWARTSEGIPAPAVGLDVVDPRHPAPDPEVVLHPRERARDLAAHAGASGAAYLWQSWARKEAVLKASGHGLAVEPATLDLGPGRPTVGPGTGRERWTRVRADGWDGVHVTDLQVGPLRAALAVDRGWSPPVQVDVRRWAA